MNTLAAAGGLRACVHRGTREIGGTCVELECASARLLLDLGLPLDADPALDPASLLPAVPGLNKADQSLYAIVLSHSHADHWGLIPHAGSPVRVVAGAATRRILRAAAPFVPRSIPAQFGELDDGPTLADRVPITIGPFRITPYLVDHSAYDAYALLIEAGGRRLFYSGDLRAHGRKGALFERLLREPPPAVDAMLMEGSSLGRLMPGQSFPTEGEIEERFVERLRDPGFVGVCASAQNIDRVVSLYRAAKRTGRTLVLDLYALEVLRATGNPNIPAPGWPNLAVYVPQYQRRQIARSERFDLLAPYKPYRIYPEGLSELAPRAVMLFRPAMLRDVDALSSDVWPTTRVIWSQWEGYLKDETGSGAKLRAELASRGVGLEVIHTSGHASIDDLKRLVEAVQPRALVPVHTFAGDRFTEHFGPSVTRRADGEWWPV
ncbi:MBL fold metallo-hydrolase [Methylobacterium radiodurans]|uniref:MBL fold metallo-hydrolase n=1 Tax=Methylobacterium radiodurans TaxID=2202828 RepID=A0A2U8VZN4_9HYPH|nr:MBL fold metallo-hydrolase [Methylobacterium radiodurans]